MLVDTSVLIGFLKGDPGEKVLLFEEVLARKVPFGISALTYQEVLQGARDEKEFARLEEYLGTQTIYYPGVETTFYEKAASTYYTLRRKGITCSTVDVIIAVTAVEHELALLHADADFDAIGNHLPELKMLDSF